MPMLGNKISKKRKKHFATKKKVVDPLYSEGSDVPDVKSIGSTILKQTESIYDVSVILSMANVAEINQAVVVEKPSDEKKETG